MYLKENYGIVGLKGGTEVEDLSFKEIFYLRKLTKDIMPLTVKIGGPEARNDMRFLLEKGIDKALAPMIESAYGLKNFTEALNGFESYYGKKIQKAINTETITTYQNLDSIFESPFFEYIDSITVGRSDLSGSMGKTVDEPEVMEVTKNIIKKAREKGKKSSVGGKITVKNIQSVQKELGSDYINTRHIVFDTSFSGDLQKSLIEGLLFEVELYQKFLKISKQRKKAYINRIKDTYQRAGLK